VEVGHILGSDFEVGEKRVSQKPSSLLDETKFGL